MKIEIRTMKGAYDNDNCFVHARMGALNENEFVMTMQRLNRHGVDDFSLIQVCKSFDGGKTWTAPAEEPAFAFPEKEGACWVGCDAAHRLHKKTGKLLNLCSIMVHYMGNDEPTHDFPHGGGYTVYDEVTGRFSPVRPLQLPQSYGYFDAFPQSCQWVELENGDLLIPMAVRPTTAVRYATAVVRCSFDGETLTPLEVGSLLQYEHERGLYEPQLCEFGGKYYLTLRNDDAGYVSVSEDGLHYSEPVLWTWDTGDTLPNYNTQQHWLICGGKLYLVYTRKAGNNDHVFRHRAPLFMAEVNPDKLCVLRHTEVIVAPERGARLGNFGVTEISPNCSVITAAEWMQPLGCERYGSDNTIFITEVTED